MWDELGIAPSADPKVIRRAYAVRLKALDPDREPTAFARLRDAYERALAASHTGADASSDALETSPTGDPGTIVEQPSTATDRDAAAEQHRAAARETGNFRPLEITDQDDIRDRALMIALEAALRDRNAAEAIALYYRAAATGALPLAGAAELGERLLAVALDDTRLDSAAFRHLLRIVGIDASRMHAPVNPELRRRALARLAADDWYEDLLAKAARGTGNTARAQRKIARLLLGRIGRYVHPSVDPTAVRSWLTQYHVHAEWLSGRIDPRWIARLEGRLRRRQIFWLVFCILFMGGMLLQFMLLTVIGVNESDTPLWPLTIGPILVAFLLWIVMLLVKELLQLLLPGRKHLSLIGGPRQMVRAAWHRLSKRRAA